MRFKTNTLIIVFVFITITAYSQIDSLENRKIYNWKIDPYDLSLQLVEMDTMLTLFQNFNPLLKNTISSNYLGNLGTAAQSKIYYDRYLYETGFVFSEPYGIYFHLPKEQVYFNTKRQFTLFNYSNAGPKEESEQVLSVLHTQNVSKDFNFGFDYDLISSDGRYQNQEVKQNKITLFSSYQNKGYRVHTNFGLNRIKAQENGGIDSIQYLGSDEYKNRKNIPVRLEDATTQVYNTNLYLVQEYRFGNSVTEIKVTEKRNEDIKNGKDKTINNLKNIEHNKNTKFKDVPTITDTTLANTYIVSSDSIGSSNDNTVDSDTREIQMDTTKVFKFNGFSISHELIYNSDIRKFIDDDLSEDFYDNMDIFIDSLKTNDEVQQKQFGNKLSLNYKYYDKFSIRFSFYNEQMHYKYNIRPDTLNADTLFNSVQDTSINYTIKSNIEDTKNNSNVSFYMKTILFQKILFSGFGEYYISGYKKENSTLDFKFAYFLGKNTEISLEGNYKNFRPDYFYENFTSNNFKWEDNHLRRIEEWDAGFVVRNVKYKLYAQIKYGQLSNHIYLDTTANLNQFKGQINILSTEVSKHFKLGPINSITRFVYQKSTQDSIVALPEYNLYQSLYYERLTHFQATGGEMLWQVGFDYRFASNYMADGYMPASGLFYRQFKHEQVDYHCLDVFINVKIKRARFYFKYHYLNSIISKNYYFTSPYYPSPEPLFKFGLAWTFYD